jgi:hypothetical protein
MVTIARDATALEHTTDLVRQSLPRIADSPALAARSEGGAPNPVFELVVQGEHDVVGLLAYGLYKQNKRDWLIAHLAKEGREPTAAESDAFILGERIPRRVATYRRLAEDMLASDSSLRPMEKPGLLNGLMAQPANDTLRTHAAVAAAARQPITWRYIAFLLGLLVVMAVLFRVAAGWLFGTGR